MRHARVRRRAPRRSGPGRCSSSCGARARPARGPAAAPLADRFPKELVDWVPYEGNPLFAGTGQATWDREIRERGFILREGDAWKLWYTGYDSSKSEVKSLGYATSPDGIHWTRHPGNPVFDGSGPRTSSS